MKKHSDRISLPVMECRDNCGACCGPFPCQEWEYQRVQTYAKQHDLTPLRQGSTCPWFQQGKCTVYEVRPFPCRLFGHVPGMVCKHGLNVNIDRQSEERAQRAYLRDGRLTRFLHEALGDGWHLEAMKIDEERHAVLDKARAASVISGTSADRTAEQK